MVCIAVTVGGFGDIWRFQDRATAYCHPLVQYGDSLLCSPDDVYSQYSGIEWNHLRGMAGLRPDPEDYVRDRKNRERQAESVYEALLRVAREPPTDPRQICEMVSQDRVKGTVTVAKLKTTAPAPAPIAPIPPPKPRVIGVKGPRSIPHDAIVRMGTDPKTGKKYGPDHNPKKPGSKTHGRFAHYRDGLTVAKVLELGVETGDLMFDRDHGFVSFEGGTLIDPSVPAPESTYEGIASETTVEVVEQVVEQVEELFAEESEED